MLPLPAADFHVEADDTILISNGNHRNISRDVVLGANHLL
jgi:hypothetical protein